MLSSLSFGSHHECSNSAPPAQHRSTMRGAATPPSCTFRFRSALGFRHPKTRIHVRLLGPCFKTGRTQPFHQHHQDNGAHPSSNPIATTPTCAESHRPELADSKHLPAPRTLTPGTLALLTSVPIQNYQRTPIRPQRASPPRHLEPNIFSQKERMLARSLPAFTLQSHSPPAPNLDGNATKSSLPLHAEPTTPVTSGVRFPHNDFKCF